MSKTFRRDLTGQRFGRLTVVEFALRPETNQSYWLCKCDCGKEKIIKGDSLISNMSMSCGCFQKEAIKEYTKKRANIKIGLKFNKLLIKNTFKKNNFTYAICRCDCGNEKIILLTSVVNGRIKSCGCFKKESLSKRMKKDNGVASLNSLLNRYKNSAKRRKILFDLNEKIFINIINKNCFYCNKKPSSIYKNYFNNGDYIYNGIDRIDSSKGYTEDNTVTCCGTCNTMKMALGQEEFLNHIKRIYEYQHLERSTECFGLLS